LAVLGVASLLVAPLHKAFAPVAWNAQLTVDTVTNKTSKAFAISWDKTYPVGCEPTRLMIRYNKAVRSTASSPSVSDTTDGTFLGWEDAEDTARTHIVVQDTGIDEEDSGWETYPGLLAAMLWNG
jgi:hypothetical protein